jgi:[acyl-carrier-protein] S-malonyltransferase
VSEESALALIFPGQGSQQVGMGSQAFQQSLAARQVFQMADDTLGFRLSKVCFEGPEEALRQTVNSQPAILVCSLAYLAWFRADGKLQEPARFLAGHSLGEYTALVAAGSLEPEDAVRLVRERGRLMQEAGNRVASGMAAVLGLEEETLVGICRQASSTAGGTVQVANLNCPGQIVISGSQNALKLAMETARSQGAKRAVALNVSGAFHSQIMEPASLGLAQFVKDIPMQPALIPVVANVTALPISQPQEIRKELVAQLCSPVRWQASMEYMLSHGVTTFIEVGPGDVLSGLLRRISPKARIINVG